MRFPCVLVVVAAVAAVVVVADCRREAAHEPPAPEADAPQGETPWFTEITREVGLEFVHVSGAQGRLLYPEIAGSGVALFDADNDGDLDVYFTSGHFGLPERLRGDAPTNRFFRHESTGRFHDATEDSGLTNDGYGMGVAIGDIDNDGDLDLYATNFGADRLYRNRGDGTFEDITESAGIKVPEWSTSAAFFDYDRDGFLDLYVAVYVAYEPSEQCFDPAGRPDYCGPQMFKGISDALWHNNGDGTFTNVSDRAGLTSIAMPGLGVVCEDFNDDGWVDVYVANDRTANQLWINQGDGTFQDEALLAGAAFNLNGMPEGSMGVVAADLDNDEDIDLFLTHFVGESNTFYRNLGGAAGFEDASGASGLSWPSLPYTGFGAVSLDVELDGDLDLAVVNGRVIHGDLLPGTLPPAPWDVYCEPNLFFLNDGDGRFTRIEDPVAAFCAPIEISRALVVGDIDQDGDLDLLVTNIEGPARLYRNDAPREGHWLMIRAVDPQLRRDAIGARVTVAVGDRRLVRTISAGFSYLSSNDPRAHFGLGDCTKVEYIDVRWPDGYRERFPSTPVDRHLVLSRGDGRAQP